MPPSFNRKLLALYIDFLFYAAIFTPARWLIRRLDGPEITPLVEYVLFALIRGGLVSLLGSSPGRWAIGISGYRAPTVEPSIMDRETWWTMLAGTTLVLEGSKNLVRWTQGLPPPPFLGVEAPETVVVALVCVIGLVNVFAGLQVLRAKPVGAFVGAAVVAFESAAALFHRDAFLRWAEQAVHARRAIQGLPVRNGEIQFMQDFASLYMPIAMAAGVAWLILVGVRLRRGPVR